MLKSITFNTILIGMYSLNSVNNDTLFFPSPRQLIEGSACLTAYHEVSGSIPDIYIFPKWIRIVIRSNK